MLFSLGGNLVLTVCVNGDARLQSGKALRTTTWRAGAVQASAGMDILASGDSGFDDACQHAHDAVGGKRDEIAQVVVSPNDGKFPGVQSRPFPSTVTALPASKCRRDAAV